MRSLIILAMCLISVCAFAEPDGEVNELAEDFSMAMGIDQLLAATLQQTRASVGSSMLDLSADLKSQYPNITESESAALDQIMTDYINAIIDSVDTNKAARIYADVIAEGLPAEEIEAATEYYETPEGRQLLLVVGVAASQLNQYILDQMAASTKVAQVKLTTDLGTLIAEIANK